VEVVNKKRMHIFAGSSYPELAREVADHLGMRVGEVKLAQFANGELYARFGESIRGGDVFVLQSHLSIPGGMSINDFVIEQLIMLDALKRASAKRTVAVVPYYGYSRSDKKARSREAIAARMIADMYESTGVDRIMSVDLHTGQIQGFFDDPWMVGDRHHDVEAGLACGVPAVGVTWGSGDRTELTTAGAVAVVDAPEQLPAVLGLAV